MKTNITLLISGDLGYNLLIELYCYVNIQLIATDKKSIKIVDFAKNKNIPMFVGNPREGKLASFISNSQNELLLSINYLFLLEGDVIKKFKYPINLHGSLLPKYRGRTPHVWAIINNEKETGVTAHFIDEGCDTGDIILQKKIPIFENDTGFSVLEKYTKIYPIMVREIINLYKSNKIKKIKQNESIASVFGKRTPDDGKINWNWQKERIKNWVRAQAFPYPGAFTFFNDNKIIIDSVSFSEIGFKNKIPNGTILAVKPNLVIKTPNGAIKLEKIRNELEFRIVIGDKLV